MKINEHTALFTPKVLLVPYFSHHVPKYHNWMQDPSLQALTASEPLTLEEEYSMQKSWRTDADKLTFIVCTTPDEVRDEVTAGKKDGGESMVGDVNLFLVPDDEEGDEAEAEEEEAGKDARQALVGEVEIMIAEKTQQGKGLGKEVLLTFVWYILHACADIMGEYWSSNKSGAKKRSYITYLRVKIDKDNVRSIKLFQGVGFSKVSETPNYFGELELRWSLGAASTKIGEGSMGSIPKLLAYKS